MCMAFTFHYELIITLALYYKCNMSIKFTFHYELIITKKDLCCVAIVFAFTFHYELIITKNGKTASVAVNDLHFTMN